jgi:hypothetical protein
MTRSRLDGRITHQVGMNAGGYRKGFKGTATMLKSPTPVKEPGPTTPPRQEPPDDPPPREDPPTQEPPREDPDDGNSPMKVEVPT